MDGNVLDAASDGKLELVKRLLENGKLNRKSLVSNVVKTRLPCFNPTPLSKASENGHTDVVKELVPFYHEATNFECGCPLHVACLNGHAGCARIIAANLPHLVNEEDEDGLSPIHVAAKTGHTEVANVLLEAGADVNKTAEVRYLMHRKYGSYTALYWAASRGHADIVKALLIHGADPLTMLERDEDCLDLYSFGKMLCPLSVATYSGHIKVLEILSEVVPLDQTYGSQAVVVAAMKEQNDCLRYLLEKGAPTFNHLEEDSQFFIWNDILVPGQNAEPAKRIEASKMLLNHGMTLYAIVNIGNINVSTLFVDMPLSTLKFLLDCGYFELRYHKYNNQWLHGQKDDLVPQVFHSPRLDFSQIVPHFRSRMLVRKLETVLTYFPQSVASVLPLSCYSFGEDIYDAVFDSVSPLLHLCRWTIRCSLLGKHDFISQDLIVKLKLPPSLQRYLFHK